MVSAMASDNMIMEPIADDALSALSLDDLRELMRQVDHTTRSLQDTHRVLHQEVARLQRELAEANAQLRRSKALAALGEMAAGIAHEIRNPLGSIQLYTQMLAEDLADDPSGAELCEKINRAVFGLDSIVRDVLLFARDMKIHPRPVEPDALMERALESCTALLLTADVEVEFCRGESDSIELCADHVMITQALTNVVRNAVEAIMEYGPDPRTMVLKISAKMMRCPDGRRARRVVFAVRDTGPGIPEQVVQRMFNPFFTTRATGTGLGLAIVHRIVDAHGGHVQVRSPQSGGAVVELCLPVSPVGSSDPDREEVPATHTDAMELARAVRGDVVKEDES